ncbi:MAG: hypothetical protein M3P38_07800 [Chloroflexota bacterium]|nr:hypothetical protein [Chloroflexota bacterium]
MIPLAIFAGYLAGLAIAILAVAAENSRIAFGSYALYGNGALIVPAILAPFALYPGWTWLLAHEGDRRLEAALYALGLHFGVGMWAVFEVMLSPQSVNVTLLSAAPGLLLSGALFVLPAALLGAATLWLVRSGHVAITPLTALLGFVIAALTGLLFGVGLGILSGGAVAHALDRPARRIAIGIALLVLLIVTANAPIIAALMTSSGPTR